MSAHPVADPQPALPELLAQLDATLADDRLSDDERRVLVHTLREASPPEDGLRQLRNRAFDLVRARTADPEQLALLKWLEGVVRAIDTGRSPDNVAVRSQAFFSPGTACLQATTRSSTAAATSASCAPPASRSPWTAPMPTCITSSRSSTVRGCSTAATTGRAAPANSTRRTWC